MLTNSEIKEIQESILKWFESNQRSFPWRNTRDPFSILIAEKLLQQTRASENVVEAYENILLRYPNPKSLAKANYDDLFEIINPLGLHYRARELVEISKQLIEKHNGKVPDNIECLLKLKGVGQYCSRAVLCFAYNIDIAIVDTNVARFLHRLFGLNGPMPPNPARSSKLIKVSEILIPIKKGRDTNYAILDLCSILCKKQKPKCQECPINSCCCYHKINN